MKIIQYLILRLGLYAFFALVTSPIAFVSIWGMKYLAAHGFDTLRLLFIPVLLVWFFSLSRLANQTARKITFENQMFWAAVKLTFHDLRLRMAFLPLVGHWFEFKVVKKETDNDHA